MIDVNNLPENISQETRKLIASIHRSISGTPETVLTGRENIARGLKRGDLMQKSLLEKLEAHALKKRLDNEREK